MVDAFYRDFSGPAGRGAAVTTSDSTTYDPPPRALWIGGAGTLALVGQDDVAFTLTAVPAGALLSVGPKKILLTGTTATAIVALY